MPGPVPGTTTICLLNLEVSITRHSQRVLERALFAEIYQTPALCHGTSKDYLGSLAPGPS